MGRAGGEAQGGVSVCTAQWQQHQPKSAHMCVCCAEEDLVSSGQALDFVYVCVCSLSFYTFSLTAKKKKGNFGILVVALN